MNPQAPVPLDPAVADMQRRWKECGIPDLYEGGDGPVSRERARNVRAVFYPSPKLAQGEVLERTIDGRGGPLAIRVVRPVQGPVIGTLVFLHGGGFILGDLDSHQAHAVRLANEAGVVVVHVDYRLAPEHRFPAAAEDAETALQWAHEHRAELGGAERPLAVAGDSAGGNLAAVAALYARDRGIDLAVQLLIYPATNLTRLKGIPEQKYLGPEMAQVGLDPRASPLLGAHAGLAPAIIGVGQHDFLYRDNLAYAEALQQAGVPVLLREFPDLNHGFFSFTAISASSAAAASLLCADLRTQLSKA